MRQETVLVHLLLCRPELAWTLLLPRLSDYSRKWVPPQRDSTLVQSSKSGSPLGGVQTRPTLCRTDSVASTLLVAARVVFHSDPQQQQALLHPTVTALLPWTMLHNQSIRCWV